MTTQGPVKYGDATGARPGRVADVFPLTAWQQVALLADPGRTGEVSVAFEGPWDRPALIRALADLVRRHPVLRSTVDLPPSGGPVHLVHPAPATDPAELALDGRPRTRAEGGEVADLPTGPLGLPASSCCTVRRSSGGGVEVSLRLAGPMLDRRSGALLTTALLRGYAAELRGRRSADAPPVTGMRDMVAAEWGAVTAEATRYWRRTLDRAADGLAWRTPDVWGTPDATVARGVPAVAALAPDLVARLRRTALMLGTSGDALLLAAYLRVLALIAGTGTAGAWLLDDARGPAGIDGEALGDFRSLLPVSMCCDVPTWASLVERTGAALAAHRPYRLFPVAELVDTGSVPGALFEYCEMPPAARPPAGELPGAVDRTVTDSPVAPLTLTVEDAAETGGMTLRLFRHGGDPAEILGYYLRALTEITVDAERDPRSSAPLLGPVPAGSVSLRPAEPAPPSSAAAEDPVTLHGLIARQAARTPDAPAVIDGDTVIGYAELYERATDLADRIRTAGVAPQSLVGVHVPPGADLVVALVAVLAAGCAFLPLDVRYPRRRCEFALGDADADLLLTRSDAADRLDFAGPTLILDRQGGGPEGRRSPLDRIPPEFPAYVLYTSGSTGRPKGVVMPHSAAVEQMRWAVEAFGLRPGDRVAQRTPVAFDAALWEFFAPLSCGAAVVTVPSGADRDIAALETVLTEGAVTVLQVVPSLLAVLAESSTLTRCPELRLLCCGGEALPQRLADAVIGDTGATLLNLYGPTETCVDATWWRAEAGAPGTTVPIGRPVTGVRLYLLDELGEPVPPGTPGEIFIGGAQLAWGYRGRAGETAERFVPDHLSGRPGDRLYRTGDRARRLPGAELEFLNRTDDQVKVRGVRTEPGEVEAALADHPRVRHAAVVPYRDGAGEASDGVTLTAFVSWAGGPPAEDEDAVAELRDHLRGRIPEAMVPTTFITLSDPPLLPNGKLDRRRLRTIDAAGNGERYRPPAEPVEERLASGFAEVLGLDAVGRSDDLVWLGARPLRALRLAARAAREAGGPVSAAHVLSRPTVSQLAEAVEPDRRRGPS
ncbi:non-ribosomal peptide synthetase [Actinomadura mexicana]|uniref:Amino acid adenylation domain-containing protein n=1 Tax=Actinomadura mexicana TaxID=134959 RepID=A0A238VMW2_9ACTN|nr:amino acid adenylation domain-containing protein [Actinomadura mexicana]SNR35504.1 amino acid adenylation domain-containing protein [Actinomadura mexicana]